MTQSKLIDYAYPTSETAVKSGFGKTGCYYISIHETETSWKELKRSQCFKTKQEAIDFANKIPLPFHAWHYKYFINN